MIWLSTIVQCIHTADIQRSSARYSASCSFSDTTMESVFPGSVTTYFIGNCQTYRCYFWSREAIEITFFCLFVLPGIFWPITSCWTSIMNNEALSCCGCGWTEPVVQFVFGSVLKEHVKDGERGCTIFNYKAPRWYKAFLFSNVLQLLGIGLMQFWDNFLLEESRICTTDPNLACFRSNPTLSTLRLDCSNTSFIEKNNITSFSCYRFVFKLGPATGSAVGIVTTTAFIIKYIIPYFLLKISKGTSGSKCQKYSTIVMQLTLALVAVLLTSLTIYLRYAISYSLFELLNAVRYLPIGYLIASNIIFVPWYKFESDESSQEPYNDITSSVNYTPIQQYDNY